MAEGCALLTMLALWVLQLSQFQSKVSEEPGQLFPQQAQVSALLGQWDQLHPLAGHYQPQY